MSEPLPIYFMINVINLAVEYFEYSYVRTLSLGTVYKRRSSVIEPTTTAVLSVRPVFFM